MTVVAEVEFDPSTCADHFSLFRWEIKALIDVAFLDWIDEANAIFGERGAQLREILSYDGGNLARKDRILLAKEYVYQTIIKLKPMELMVYFLKNCDERVYNEFMLADVSAESKAQLLKHFYRREDGRSDIMEHLSSFIRPDEFLDDLKRSRYARLYEPLIAELQPMTIAKMIKTTEEAEEEPEEGEEKKAEGKKEKKYMVQPKRTESDVVACLILRRFPLVEESGEWIYHLLTVLRDSRYHYFLPDAIDKDYALLIDKYEAERRSKEVEDELKVQGHEDDYIDEEVGNSLEFRPQEDYLSYISHRVAAEDLVDPLELSLRLYQEELVEQLAKEKNGIVCAPTGSGKTIVATHLILEHLNTRRERAEPARVALLVPKVPLVRQQLLAIFDYAPRNYNLSGFDETMKGRGYLTLASDVVVLTPQVLINMLRSPKRIDHLNLSDFTMLVFDECHHCHGDHPYKVLMDMVNEYEGNKPRVVGLTASVGVGRSGNIQGAIDHILTLCVSMNAQVISSVQKQKADLFRMVEPPIDELIRVDRFSNSKFLRLLGEFLGLWNLDLQKMVHDAVEKKMIVKEFEKQIKDPEHGNMDPYISYLGMFEMNLKARQSFPEQVQQLRTVAVLKAYAIAVEYFDLLPNRFAMEHLIRKCKSLGSAPDESAKCAVYAKFMKEIYALGELMDENCAEDKPILNELKKLIERQFEDMPESRVLVFVEKRFMAESVCKHLDAVCGSLFGGVKTVGYITRGQPSGVQKEMLDQFNHGIIKVLVATSIAEEGIDVAGCNLIIKYNTAGSATTFIQRKGRGRAKGSKAFLLALNSRTESQEMDAMRDAYLMEHCLLDLKARGEVAMVRRIEEKRVEVRSERDLERRRQKAREQELKTKEFEMLCKVCGRMICHSSVIRQFFDLKKSGCEYIICDPDLWNIVTIVPTPPMSYHGAIKIGNFHCGECGTTELGPVYSFAGVLIVVPKIANLIFNPIVKNKNNLQDTLRPKRWNDVARTYFFISKSRFSEVRNMYRAFVKSHSSTEIDEIEKRAEEGRIIESRKEREQGRKYRQKRIKEREEAEISGQRAAIIEDEDYNEYADD